MKLLVAAVVMIAAGCGGSKPAPVATTQRAPTPGETILALLPEGAQIIVELDLARLRANPALGETAKLALASLGTDSRLPGLPLSVLGSPLASADQVVLAAYGVGTAQAVTLTVLATHAEVPNGVRISPELVSLGPTTGSAS